MPADIIENNIKVFIISETKLDLSFPKGQSQLHGYPEPYRFDKNGNGGIILLFFREDIPSKLIESQMRIEGLSNITLILQDCQRCGYFNTKL